MTTHALQDAFLPDNACFGCGPANPEGLQLKTYEDGEEFVAEWTADDRYQGPPEVVNGGFLAVPMDCHSTWAAMHALSEARGGDPIGAVTAGYSVTLRRPTPTGRPITFRARVTKVEGRHAKVHTTAEVDGEVTAEFDGTFVAVEVGD